MSRSVSLFVTALMTSAVACTGMIMDPFSASESENGAAGPGGAGGAGGEGPGGSSSAPLCTTGDSPGPRVMRLLTRDEWAKSLADLLGVAKPSIDELPVEPRVVGFDNNASASVVTSRHVDAYLARADELVRKGLATSRAKIVSCDFAQNGCTRTFVEKFGRRVFRRPLREAEITRYLGFFSTELTHGNADEGATLAATSMLIAPSFLYRSELGVLGPDGTYALTPFEIATALSFTFLGTTPDDALLDSAAKGELGTPESVETAARRLLADPRAKVQVARFAGQWLDTSALLSANKDKTVYPSFTDAVREGMAEEQQAFVIHVIFDSTKTFSELLTADYVFANATVATFYGLSGAGTTPVKLAAGPNRGGLLTLGSILASQAHSNESSPIKRGKFVRDRLLCQELSPPPPSVDATPPGLDPTLTTRERFAKHTANIACRSCHQFIDGVGFGFERYDGVGGYRELENGKSIDSSGELRGREGFETNTVEAFDGPRALGALLAKGESAPRCFATQWYRFARGIKEEGVDACSAQRLGTLFLEKGQNVQELLVAVVLQRSFLVRRADVVTSGTGGAP